MEWVLFTAMSEVTQASMQEQRAQQCRANTRDHLRREDLPRFDRIANWLVSPTSRIMHSEEYAMRATEVFHLSQQISHVGAGSEWRHFLNYVADNSDFATHRGDGSAIPKRFPWSQEWLSGRLTADDLRQASLQFLEGTENETFKQLSSLASTALGPFWSGSALQTLVLEGKTDALVLRVKNEIAALALASEITLPHEETPRYCLWAMACDPELTHQGLGSQLATALQEQQGKRELDTTLFLIPEDNQMAKNLARKQDVPEGEYSEQLPCGRPGRLFIRSQGESHEPLDPKCVHAGLHAYLFHTLGRVKYPFETAVQTIKAFLP